MSGTPPSSAAIVVMRIGRKRSKAASRIACSGSSPSRSRLIAKSTRMMPFFFTMPMSKMMPMMPITERSKPPSHSASRAPMPAEGRVERIVSGVNIALVQDAEDHVDGDERGEDEDRLACQRALERLSVALKTAGQRWRFAELGFRTMDRLHRLTERHAGRKVER